MLENVIFDMENIHFRYRSVQLTCESVQCDLKIIKFQIKSNSINNNQSKIKFDVKLVHATNQIK